MVLVWTGLAQALREPRIATERVFNAVTGVAMLLDRLLNACHHFPGFVYAAVRLVGATSTIEVDMRPRSCFRPHPLLAVELDLHHNILPPTASTPIDADLLLARLVSSRWPRWHVLQPIDQMQQSAAHLFNDFVDRNRLRDLVDLDGP